MATAGAVPGGGGAEAVVEQLDLVARGTARRDAVTKGPERPSAERSVYPRNWAAGGVNSLHVIGEEVVF
jgi:hypothetical protein